MSEEKAKARECEHGVLSYQECVHGCHKQIEASALQEAQKEIADLKAKLWVAKDNALRTYDGLAEKADKYDEANEMLEKMAAALLLYKDICTWKDESGDEFIAAKALKEYEDWKKR